MSAPLTAVPDDGVVVLDQQTPHELLQAEGREQVELAGRKFFVAAKVGAMAMLKYAHVAKHEDTVEDLDASAATYDFLRAAIDKTEWLEFEQHAVDELCDLDDLLNCANEAIQVISARPTKRPSDSLSGPSSSAPTSSESSSSPASSTPQPTTASASTGPTTMMRDPRVVALRPVEDLAMDLLLEQQDLAAAATG